MLTVAYIEYRLGYKLLQSLILNYKVKHNKAKTYR